MGEFVHLGEPAVPVLVKGLTMPGPRIRYNVIETISMLKAASAVPALVTAAKEPNEVPRVREHALRVAVRLDAAKSVDAIEVMAKDQNSSIRKAAAFESRYVREKAVVPILIGMIADEERFVAISAVQSLWILTRHETEFHDWETSTKQDRQEWMGEWVEWWNGQKDSFELPDPETVNACSLTGIWRMKRETARERATKYVAWSSKTRPSPVPSAVYAPVPQVVDHRRKRCLAGAKNPVLYFCESTLSSHCVKEGC